MRKDSQMAGDRERPANLQRQSPARPSFFIRKGLAAGLLCALPHAALMAETGIHPWLDRGDQLTATLNVDGKVVCQIHKEVAPDDGMRREPSCVFAMPAGAKTAVLTGTLKRHGVAKPVMFNRQWKLVDAAPYTQAIHDPQASLGQRWLNWSKQLDGFQKKHPDEYFSAFRAKPGPAVAAEIEATEERLRMPLPAALKEVLRLQIEAGDSRFHKPKELVTVEQMLLGDWDYKSLDKILPPAVLARYRRSVAVFTEVGDGLGALAFDPQGVQTGETSNAWGDQHGKGAQPSVPPQGVWFWIHQDSIDQPTLLLTRERKAASDEQALLSVLQRFEVSSVLESVVEAGWVAPVDDEKTIWVDSAHPRALMQLHFDEKKPKLWLRSYDHFYSLLAF